MRPPVLGYGFAGFWTMMRVAEHDIGQAHNGYFGDLAAARARGSSTYSGMALILCQESPPNIAIRL